MKKINFLSLIFPPLCLHCEEKVSGENRFFCRTCASSFVLIPPSQRCPYCFSERGEMRCCGHKSKIMKVGAALEYVGPAQTLIKNLKFGKMTFLAEVCGEFCLAQLHRLRWPMPDVIVPTPLSFLRYFFRGFNQSKLIGDSISKKLDIPLIDLLSRKGGGFPQASLDARRRRKLNSTSFKIKKGNKIEGKTVLLIDDVMTTGSTLNACARTLALSHPKAIYGLTVGIVDSTTSPN